MLLLFSSVEDSTNSAEASSNKFVFGQNMSERVLVSASGARAGVGHEQLLPHSSPRTLQSLWAFLAVLSFVGISCEGTVGFPLLSPGFPCPAALRRCPLCRAGGTWWHCLWLRMASLSEVLEDDFFAVLHLRSSLPSDGVSGPAVKQLPWS